MRLYEFTKVADVHAIALRELQKYLNENKQFLDESAYDYPEYRGIMDYEKSHTIPVNKLVVGEQYAPMSITGTPIGKMIMIFTTDVPVMFASVTNTKSTFKDTDNGIHQFPASDHDLNDSCVDLCLNL